MYRPTKLLYFLHLDLFVQKQFKMDVSTIINLVKEAKQIFVNTRNTDPTAREELLRLKNELLMQIADIRALVRESDPVFAENQVPLVQAVVDLHEQNHNCLTFIHLPINA